jgi:pimeloyl-ACP methyl ester carboxylesterase
MEQEIRFCELDGRRIAYATIGEGPALLFGGRWVSHLEEEWDDPRVRGFYEELARTHRVVRYDRLGAVRTFRGRREASPVPLARPG